MPRQVIVENLKNYSKTISDNLILNDRKQAYFITFAHILYYR